ncbi:MAG: HD domain-containing protein [Treponema sp.]|nr:HD domain-containing protein [Candidatus Treponema merdequi]
MANSSREDKLQRIIELEKKLGEIQDVDVLLERILTEARSIVHADAGSIYVVDGTNLKIKYAQNDTQLKAMNAGEKLPYTFFSFPINETSISGYVAYSGEPLNIEDAYEIPADKPYTFNKTTDRTTDYRTKSIYTIPLKTPGGKILGILQIINAQNDNGEVVSFDNDAELFITHFAQSAIKALENAYLKSNMVRRMLRMAEFRDPKETYPHVERVSSFALEIYDRWAYNHNVPSFESHKFRDTLKIAAKFHDVGKVGVSDVILKKKFPRFTDEERSIMQGHTCIGANLFEPPESFLDEMCRDIALFHHERWDGGDTAYPGALDYKNFIIGEPLSPARHLSGEEIPLAARIVAVADVFDALSHKRCYKEAWKIDDAFAEVQADSGKHFDPEVVLAFMQVRDRISAIQLAFPDEE